MNAVGQTENDDGGDGCNDNPKQTNYFDEFEIKSEECRLQFRF